MRYALGPDRCESFLTLVNGPPGLNTVIKISLPGEAEAFGVGLYLKDNLTFYKLHYRQIIEVKGKDIFIHLKDNLTIYWKYLEGHNKLGTKTEDGKEIEPWFITEVNIRYLYNEMSFTLFRYTILSMLLTSLAIRSPIQFDPVKRHSIAVNFAVPLKGKELEKVIPSYGGITGLLSSEYAPILTGVLNRSEHWFIWDHLVIKKEAEKRQDKTVDLRIFEDDEF